MTDPFRVLLNRISAQLNEQEIRSLVLMCRVPESLRAGMKDGISLFDSLIKRDVISPQKVDNLKTMLKTLNPKRRDLIREIENFESGTLTPLSAASTLTSITSMPSLHGISHDHVKKICCTLECPCMVLSCYNYKCKINCNIAYILLAAVFSICFVSCALLWYADVPKVSEAITSDEHVKKAGPYILTSIVVLFLFCLLIMFYVGKLRSNRSSSHLTSTAENRTGVQDGQARSESINLEDRGNAPNFAFSRHIDEDPINEDSGNDDPDTDQDAMSRGSSNAGIIV